PNRVADALAQQDAQPDRATDAAGLDGTGLRHPEMDGVLPRHGELAVGHDVRPHVGRLERDLDVARAVVEVLEDLAVAERHLDHAVRRALTVVTVDVVLLAQRLVYLFRQRPGIDPNPKRDLAFLGCIDNLHDLLAVGDVAGVQTEAVHAGL